MQPFIQLLSVVSIGLCYAKAYFSLMGYCEKFAGGGVYL